MATVTRVCALAIIAYQIWWSLQPACPLRQLAETAAALQAGDDVAAPPRRIPLSEVVFPYLLIYWGLLGTGGACIFFPAVMGRWLAYDPETDNGGRRPRDGQALAPAAWIIGWSLVFILPGVLMACAQWRPGKPADRPEPPNRHIQVSLQPDVSARWRQ